MIKEAQGHARIQRGDGGGGGVRVVQTPLKIYRKIGFLSNAGPDPLKITKLPGQHWPAFSGNWILSPLIKEIKLKTV